MFGKDPGGHSPRGREGFLPSGLAAEAFSLAEQELRRQISLENVSQKFRFCSIFV